MTLVLLILAAVWAAVLIPPALRARQEGRPGDSITHFRRQLAVLRRTGPSGPFRDADDALSTPHPLARVSRLQSGNGHASSNGHYRPALPNGHSNGHSNGSVANGSLANGTRPQRYGGRPRPSSAARSRTLRRRRDVLSVLAAAAALTLLVALVSGLAAPWVLAHLAADVLLALYVGLLIHQRNAAAEREMKVRFLPTAPFDPDALTGDPTLLRRSAN